MLVTARRIVCRFCREIRVQGDARDLALQHPHDRRWPTALVQRVQDDKIVPVRMGAPLIMQDIIHPAAEPVFLDPDIGITQIADQCPIAGPVT